MTRQTYIEARQAFLNSELKPVVTPVLAGNSIAGWSIARDGNVLPSSRNDTRVFKTLNAVVILCEEHEIKSFEVTGI